MGCYYETFNPPFFLDLSFRPDLLTMNCQGYTRDSNAILRDIERGLRLLRPRPIPQIQFHLDNQIVTLIGTVASLDDYRYIERLTENTLGVRGVQNNLIIERMGASKEIAPASESQDHLKNVDPVFLGKTPASKVDHSL